MHRISRKRGVKPRETDNNNTSRDENRKQIKKDKERSQFSKKTRKH